MGVKEREVESERETGRKTERKQGRESEGERESQREQMAQGEVKGIIPSAALSTDHLDIPQHNYNTFQQAEQRTASQGHIRPV